MSVAVEVKNLNYKFAGNSVHSLSDINLVVPWNKRVVIVGSNGAGKSTLLKILGGKHLILNGSVTVDGSDPFNNKGSSNNLTRDMVYLGSEWCHMSIVNRDIGVQELLDSVGYRQWQTRGELLCDILSVDKQRWRMHQLSDGQKRRVQLVMGLLQPFKILLLDEVTVDLDVVGRDRLFQFLYTETRERHCSVIYATHILDGLSDWPSSIVHLSHGKILDQLENGDETGSGDILFRDAETRGKDSQLPSVEFHEQTDNTPKKVFINKIKSLHPLVLTWLLRDEKSSSPQPDISIESAI